MPTDFNEAVPVMAHRSHAGTDRVQLADVEQLPKCYRDAQGILIPSVAGCRQHRLAGSAQLCRPSLSGKREALPATSDSNGPSSGAASGVYASSL